MIHPIALLVLGWLAVPATLLGVWGGAVLALNHVGHTPGALEAEDVDSVGVDEGDGDGDGDVGELPLRIPVAGEAGGWASVLELRNSRTSRLWLLALAPLQIQYKYSLQTQLQIQSQIQIQLVVTFSIGAPHWTPPGLHLAQSFLLRSNQQGWSATGFAFLPLPVVTGKKCLVV